MQIVVLVGPLLLLWFLDGLLPLRRWRVAEAIAVMAMVAEQRRHEPSAAG